MSLRDAPLAGVAEAPGSGIVCATCSTKLAAEIAADHTAVLPVLEHKKSSATVMTISDRRLGSELLEPPDELRRDGEHSSSFKSNLNDLPAIEEAPARKGRTLAVPEFEFARKRHFGSYELLGEISRGSFGVVYKARQAGLDRTVALKVLLDGVHASPESIERFQREAKSVARMKHPNIVPIYDIGTCDGHYYFAMEFIEGHPLSTHILARELSISHALAIAEATADAIECAHRAGVIHRDIKPSNILIDKAGEPHITDFGLAKQVDLENKYTLSGTTLGTPAYMPPEQARGQLERIDARSDVYAIGTVLYEMLTGLTPFAGRSLLEVVVAVINEPVPPPRSLNPKIHRDIQTIVLKCLEKDQALRYSSAAELRDDLRRFRSGESILAKPAGLFSRGWRFARRQKWYVASAACVALALLAVMYSFANSQKKDANIQKREDDVKKMVEELQEKERPKWIKEWSFDSAKGEGGMEIGSENMYSPQGRVAKNETWVSPAREGFFGDFKASINLVLKEESAAQGFSIGLQSIIQGRDCIPFYLDLRGQSARLIGPADLYVFPDALEKSKDAQPRFEVKLEKKLPPLRAGRYIADIERVGTDFKFTLKGEVNPLPTESVAGTDDGAVIAAQTAPRPTQWGPFSMELQDFNLSHWMMKYTQLVLPRRPAGLDLESGSVLRKFGGAAGLDVTALNNFHTGEYTGSGSEFKLLAQSSDGFNAARAHYYLGLIDEICLPKGGNLDPVIQHFLDANYVLYQLRAPQNQAQVEERATLMREIRMRLIVCYAKKGEWPAIKRELSQGWMGQSVGEALGWELQGVLEMALHEQQDPAVVEPLQAIFARSGLDPVSNRLGASAKAFGMLLAREAQKVREPAARDSFYARLRELHDDFPSTALDEVFAIAARGALPAKPDKAFELLFSMPPESAQRSPALTDCAGDTAAALARVRNHADALRLLKRFPSPRGFSAYFDELKPEVVGLNETTFYADILPKLSAAMPLESKAALERAAVRLAQALAENGRADDLIALHKAIRLGAKYDARLADYFALAVEKLALSPEPKDDDEQALKLQEQALKLLKYSHDRVSRDDAKLLQAAASLAARKSFAGPSGLLSIKAAMPTAELTQFARRILRGLSQERDYAGAVEFFKRARSQFLSDGVALLPETVAALENIEAPERDKKLDAIWSTVRDELKKQDDESASRQWALEYGDMLLALSGWEGARKQYQSLLPYVETDPATAARAALRLTAMKLARPESTGTDTLASTIAAPGSPEDIKLAAQLLSTPSPLSVNDLPDKLKKVPTPELGHAEWNLIKGLRARMDGDEAGAQQLFKLALEAAQPERLWPATVASELLRPRKAVVERDGGGIE